MKQSRKASLAESIISTALGFVVSMGILEFVNQVWGLALSLTDNMAITALFTVASVLRQYVVRRGFNWWHHRGEARGIADYNAEVHNQLSEYQGEAAPGQYVRLPAGMSMAQAMRWLESNDWRASLNKPGDIQDIMNEENIVRPIV